ncbi:J domain-containing protein, partial [Campylobacter jejuni]|nr:adenylosuccinate lyase [Campylobacter coli]EGD3546177.1 J domain-containing protein [Campylobacter coli]EHY7177372.1 J domain-containing protein [Campylobacter jejuni]EJE7730181.1 J domain-containing protein [Campylobacter coli]
NALAKLFSNYFNTLECTPQNDLSEIRQKYLILVKLYHPDFHQGKSAIEKAYAREQFEKIQIAYDNLKALYKNNT